MPNTEFDFCIDLLKKRSGLILGPDKTYLLESRLLPIAKKNGYESVTVLIESVRKNPKESILNEITEAMTTNESLFFRDCKPFEYFGQELIPALKAEGKNRIRLWSAACSTGQEPYSIAISIEEAAKLHPSFSAEITATDIAAKVLERAKKGVYTSFETQRGLCSGKLSKYFSQLPNNEWQVKSDIRSKISYRQFNLMDEYAPLGKFDVIFCRNVLIYFDEETRGKIAEKLARALNPKGYLFIGSTEIIIDRNRNFTAVDKCRGLYRLNK